MNFLDILFVGLGGILGAACRYVFSSWYLTKQPHFPLHTLVVNIIGCFLMGFFSNLLIVNTIERALICTGFIGSLTTFSTFISEVHELNKKKAFMMNLGYIICSLGLGLIMIILGEQSQIIIFNA